MSTNVSASALQPQTAFDLRLAIGLVGILIAAMVAGLSSRVPSLILVDIQGGLGFSKDDISWFTTAYSAGELATMPFATWFAVTFSLRRFHLTMLSASMLLAFVLPFIHDLYFLLALRVLHGICSGALIPVLMMAALRFLPAQFRLHGLALFAMTATLSPNVALWLAALSVDHMNNWRWAFWDIIPAGLVAMAMVIWGIPQMPMALSRLKEADWFGMMLAVPGLMLLVVGIDQGVRLDWFNSPVVVASLSCGICSTALFFICEWLHPAPFIRLELLKRRNISLGFLSLLGFFIATFSAVGLPSSALSGIHNFRLEQTDSLGLMVGLPQLILGTCVAILLSQYWIDARHVFAFGLLCIATACWLASGITDEWMVRQFLVITILHTVGQPLAMVSMLFLIVSVVQPMEGPYLAGLINIVRVMSTILAGAFTGQLNVIRSRFHYETLRDQAANMTATWAGFNTSSSSLTEQIARQSSVLAVADIYRVIGLVALLMIPLVLSFRFIPAPTVPRHTAPVPPIEQDAISSNKLKEK